MRHLVLVLALGLGCWPACDQVEVLRRKLQDVTGSGEEEKSPLDGAIALYREGQFRAAADRLERLTTESPGNADAFYYLGRCYLELAGESADPEEPLSPEEEKSLSAFNRALTLNPRHAAAAVGIGELYGRRVPSGRRRRNEAGREAYRLAIDAYEKAVTVDPSRPEPQLRYGEFLKRVGHPEEAEARYKTAVETAQADTEKAPGYYQAYGRFLSDRQGREEEAIEQLELARMLKGQDPDLDQDIAALYSRIGMRYFEAQQYSLAEQTLTKAYRMFPDKSAPEAQETSATLNQLRAMRGMKGR